MPSDPALRAGDDDRRRIVAALGDHLAAGRLTLAEYEERAGTAFAAVTLADLDELLRDLPELSPLNSRRQSTPASTYRQWQSWLVTAAICLVIWAVTSVVARRPIEFWPGWVIGPWGAVLLARATVCPGGLPR